MLSKQNSFYCSLFVSERGIISTNEPESSNRVSIVEEKMKKTDNNK